MLLEQDSEDDETYEDSCEVKEDEFSPYVKNDVLSTTFFDASYTMGMEEFNELGIKNSSSLPSLANF